MQRRSPLLVSLMSHIGTCTCTYIGFFLQLAAELAALVGMTYITSSFFPKYVTWAEHRNSKEVYFLLMILTMCITLANFQCTSKYNGVQKLVC